MTNENNAATLKAAQGGVTEAGVPGLIEMSELLRARGVETKCYRDHQIAEAAYQSALAALSAHQQGPCDPEKCHSIQENRDYWYGVAEQYRQELYDAKQALAQQGQGEAVAVIGADFTIHWVGTGPIAPVIRKHGLKVGDELYAVPPAQPAERVPEGWRADAAQPVAVFNGYVDGAYPVVVWLGKPHPVGTNLYTAPPEGWNAAITEARKRVQAMALSNGWNTDSDAYAVSCLLEDMLAASPPAHGDGGKG